MEWIIALIVIGIIIIVGYWIYYHPSLSSIAKQQKLKYLNQLRYSKELLYQVNPEEIVQLKQLLRKAYFQAGRDCFYGQDVIIYLQSTVNQLIIYLFSGSEENLARYAWKMMKLKSELGGTTLGVADG